MMIHIPFDHIKVLDDGNYGCTLLLDNLIYCAIFTSDWQIIEPLHIVDYDPYKDYTYIRDWRHAPISSYCKRGIIRPVDNELLSLFEMDLNILGCEDVAIDVEDYIVNANETVDEDSVLLLFSTNYLDKEGKIALNTENTLAPYSVIGPAAIRYIFNLYTFYGCDTHNIRNRLELDSQTKDPMKKATIQLIEWIDFVKYYLDQLSDKEYTLDLQAKTSPYKDTFFSLVHFIFGKHFQTKMLNDGLLDFPRLIYLEYLKQSAPEMW